MYVYDISLQMFIQGLRRFLTEIDVSVTNNIGVTIEMKDLTCEFKGIIGSIELKLVLVCRVSCALNCRFFM